MQKTVLAGSWGLGRKAEADAGIQGGGLWAGFWLCMHEEALKRG